jgi:adenosine deaminase
MWESHCRRSPLTRQRCYALERSELVVTASFVDGLPKAELHVHLEGTLESAMMFALAKRNAIALPWVSEAELHAAYAFTGLEHFLSVYFQGCGVLRQRQDFYDLTLAYLDRAAHQGVVRAEMMFGPQPFLDAHVALDDQLDGILEAIADARVAWGIEGALLISAHRHRGAVEALELFELVQPWAKAILGFGLGSAERGNPPGQFATYFAAARTRGFRTTCHAGEEGPASYIREALGVCHVDRIDHGVSARDDAQLIHILRDELIPLTMCPLSNLRLNVVDDLRQHPLGDLLRAGVRVTVNSDDPAYFGGYVNENYAAVGDQLSLSQDELMALARNSFSASFAAESEIARGLARIEQYRAAHPTTTGF